MPTAPTVNLDRDQQIAVAHLARNPYAGVLCDPGFGKTVVTLMAFYLLKKAGIVRKLLIVAPINPARFVWSAEVAKWKFPFSIVVLHGGKKNRLLVETDADIYVVNYEGIPWLVENIETL